VASPINQLPSLTLDKFCVAIAGSDLEGHPTPRLNFIDVATGTLLFQSQLFFCLAFSVPDPGSGAFLPPRSGMNFFQIPENF
jgi:hypothetical protein